MAIEMTSGGVSKTYKYYPYDALYVDASGNLNASGNGAQVREAYFNGTKYYPEDGGDETITALVGEYTGTTPLYVDPNIGYYPNVERVYWKYTGSTQRPWEPCHGRGANSVAVELILPICYSVYNQAFYNCTTLRRICLPMWKGTADTNPLFTDKEFAGCTSLVDVELPAVTALRGRTTRNEVSGELYLASGYSFEGCTALEHISLPLCADLYSLGTFRGCTSLRTVDLPACTVLGDGSFMNCTALESISLPLCAEIYNSSFYNCTSLQDASLPELTRLRNSAFYGCSSLEGVSIPKCTRIDARGFQNCSSLEEISAPLCTSLGDYSFYGCSNLKEVSAPLCTSVGDYSFYECSNIDYVSLPECSYVGEYGFYNCVSLSSVELPKCTYLDWHAFNGTSLISITLKSGCHIGAHAIPQGCTIIYV